MLRETVITLTNNNIINYTNIISEMFPISFSALFIMFKKHVILTNPFSARHSLQNDIVFWMCYFMKHKTCI